MSTVYLHAPNILLQYVTGKPKWRMQVGHCLKLSQQLDIEKREHDLLRCSLRRSFIRSSLCCSFLDVYAPMYIYTRHKDVSGVLFTARHDRTITIELSEI